MKCGEFAEVVHELARREQLDPAIAAIARAHAEACPSCGCRLAEAQRLAALVGTTSSETRHVGAPEYVEAGLLAAFRREHASPRTTSVTRRFGWRAAFAWVAAGAAVALLSFVLLHHAPDHRSSPVVRRSAEATGSSTPVKATGSTTTGEFVPVPYSGSLAPGDAAVIVRVQVPRTALAELGYPVDETQGNGMVQADLVVGEDGWPHAVRIVR